MANPKYSKNSVVVLTQKMLKSKVWINLTGASTQVFLIFRTKCQMEKPPGKSGKHSGMIITNNGEIIFTYEEAHRDYGISKDRFKRAIDQLVEFGFIDIKHTTNGLHKVATQYGISDRWQDWGTEQFVMKKREKRSHGPGFKKGNELWRQRKKQQVKTSIRLCAKTPVSSEREIRVMRTNDHGVKITILFNRSEGQWLGQKVG